MSKLVFSENLFLEVAELKRMCKYLDEEGYKRIIKSIVGNKWGIVTVNNLDSFLVEKISNTSVSIKPGLAFNKEAEAIVNENAFELSIDNNNNTKWIVLTRDVTHFEEGLVSVTREGVLSGIDTKFTEVLRGQPNFANRVKLDSAVNNGEYEVVSVLSDTEAVISGIFTVESNIKYSVIGTFTPGFVPLEHNKYIYEKDYFSVYVIESENRPVINDGIEFIIGKITYDNGILEVEDTRNDIIFNQASYLQSQNYGVDNILSLTDVKSVIGFTSVEIEMFVEHGCKINTYQYSVQSGNDVLITIQTFENNYMNNIPGGVIPDNMFEGWLLLNRKNMISVTVDSNSGSILYIHNFKQGLITNDNDDIVLIPNFNEIEYEVCVNPENSVNLNNVPFYFIEKIENIKNRISVYLKYPSFDGSDIATISLRYRMISNGMKSVFREFPAVSFNNINGESEILANSDFEINVRAIEPEAAQRNYS